MKFNELALAFDAQESPVEAAWAYEISICAADADLDLYLNLAVLYFECMDFGYAAHHHLSENFVSGAWDRAFQVLARAEERYGRHAEIEFWRMYIPYIYGGGEPIDDACKDLARREESLVPYMYLFTSSGKKKYAEQAQELLNLVKDGITERERYIKSILE